MNILKKETLTHSKIIRENRNFILYLFIGGLATFIDISLLFLLTDYMGIYYFYSSAISYSFGMLTNYTLNKKFNFKNKSKRIFSQFALFLFVALIGLGINQIIMFILVDFFALWYIIAKLISIIIVLFWSFFGHKNITFKYLT